MPELMSECFNTVLKSQLCCFIFPFFVLSFETRSDELDLMETRWAWNSGDPLPLLLGAGVEEVATPRSTLCRF